MKEWEIIARAARFVLQSYKLKSDKEIEDFNKDELQTFAGSIAGIIEGIAVITKEEDRRLYNKILNSLENVAWK